MRRCDRGYVNKTGVARLIGERLDHRDLDCCAGIIGKSCKRPSLQIMMGMKESGSVGVSLTEVLYATLIKWGGC